MVRLHSFSSQVLELIDPSKHFSEDDIVCTAKDWASWRWLTVDCSLVKRWCVWWFAGFTFDMPSDTVNAWWLIIIKYYIYVAVNCFYFSQFLFFLCFKFSSILYMYITIPKNELWLTNIAKTCHNFNCNNYVSFKRVINVSLNIERAQYCCFLVIQLLLKVDFCFHSIWCFCLQYFMQWWHSLLLCSCLLCTFTMKKKMKMWQQNR